MKERCEFGVDPILEMMNEAEIKGVLFDYDDTNCATAEHIGTIMGIYSRQVGDKLGIDPIVVYNLLNKHNNRYYSSLYVNPVKWILSGDAVSVELTGSKRTLKSELDILLSIFDTVPAIFNGTKSVHYLLSKNGTLIGNVTHAPEKWAIFKIDRHGLAGYIDSLVLVDVNRPKTIEDWRRGLEQLGLRPDQVIGMGDSVKGDVVPMLELGLRGVIALPNSWSVNHAEIPAGAVQEPSIAGFFDGVEKILAGKI